MSSLIPFRHQPCVVVPDDDRSVVGRGSARMVPEEAFVAVAGNLPAVIRAMAASDRDVVVLQLSTRDDGFFGSTTRPDAVITIHTRKK